MKVFNSNHGSNILGCVNLCTAGSQIFKTKEFTWFSEVKYFECTSVENCGYRYECILYQQGCFGRSGKK
jgi:hypothetical protein